MKTTTLIKCAFLFTLHVFMCFTLIAQPKERLKNRYKEPNMSYGSPYTMFDIWFQLIIV